MRDVNLTVRLHKIWLAIEGASGEQLSIIEAVLEGEYRKTGQCLGVDSYQVDIKRDTPCPTCHGTGRKP